MDAKSWLLTDAHSVKTLQSVNFLLFSNKSSHVLKNLIVSVKTYDLLLPTSFKKLKISLHKIYC